MRPRSGPLSDAQTEVPGEGGWAGSEGPLAGGGGLPRWESLPPQDRRLLVSLLIQAARRGVRPGPAGRGGGLSGARG